MKRALPLMAGVVFFALLFLLVKENEGRTFAETKLKELEYRLDSVTTEKTDVVNDLESKVASLEGKLRETTERDEAILAEKAREIEELVTRAGEAEAAHQREIQLRTEELALREERANKDTEKFERLLAEKRAEVTGLGKQREEDSRQIAALLKKKGELEARVLASEFRVEELERSVKDLDKKRAELARQLADALKTDVAVD